MLAFPPVDLVVTDSLLSVGVCPVMWKQLHAQRPARELRQ
jgi:hypothetical protein